MSYTVRPISDRTPFTGKTVSSDFTVTWSQAERLLIAELGRVRARNAVMELDLTEGQLRNDGRPKATAKVASRAVRVVFETPEGETLTFATDRFVGRYYNVGMREDWQHNVYAIAKGLEALRMMKRYGIVELDQQYAGFKALPAGRAMPASHMTATEAAEFLELVAVGDGGAQRERSVQRILESPELARQVWREARKIAHPDRRGGDQTMWDQVEQAAVVLGVAS